MSVLRFTRTAPFSCLERAPLSFHAGAPLSFRKLALLWLGLAAALAAPAYAGTPATTANDICASNADPCIVNRVYDITSNADLDFGTRAVSVTGSGQFNFGKESGRISCGNLTASTTGAAFNLAGPLSSGGTGSGSVLVLSRRRCSAGSFALACLDHYECQLGPCGVRRCSGRTTRECTGDSDCQLGTCNALRRCSGMPSVRCTANADCDYGTCPAQLTCDGRGDNPVACATDNDCDFGACSLGLASVTLDGSVAGSSDNPATLIVRAADSISISKPINLNGNTVDSDGGSLSLDARQGTITLASKINATGGGFSGGGSIEFYAGTDILIQDEINAIGGDYDGGSIDFTAERDIAIGRSLLANSNAGAGYGGDILMSAGRDVTFTGVSPSNKSTIESSGHTDIENSAGDGGAIEIYAERNLSFDANTRVIGTGSAPDGTGSDMVLEAGSNLSIHGDVVAKALGIDGSGGLIQVFADGSATMNATANFDATGGGGGGGFVEIDAASGSLEFDGMCDVSGGTGGSGGGAYLSARQGANVAGDMVASGPSGGGSLTVNACLVQMENGSAMTSSGTGGTNTLVAHDQVFVLAGSSLSADVTGTNTFRYRNASKPPVVQGSVSPTARNVVDPTLTDCPLCGNRSLDPGESCDDGNAANGDGCNADCQNENCIAQTASPGYPSVPLCDDGNVCTADVCNTAIGGGTCQHPPKNCNDGYACTEDSCDTSDGTCRHSPSDALCNDNNACTDDFCSLTMGCSNTANSSPCDDGNRCTNNDICASKACKGTRINGCLFCGDDFVNPFANEDCDDGNNENGDCCSATCHFEAADSPCEDGLFCTIEDTCDATGTCVTGVPNTCADTDACTADYCDEDLAECIHGETPRDVSNCMVAPSTRLQIKNSTNPKRDKLQWQWSGGDAFSSSDFGTPSSDTAYTLCVYDQTTALSSLRASIDIAPSATRWASKSADLIQYKDKLGISEGVLKAQLKSGEAGSTKVKIGAGGPNLALPAPAGASYFRQEPSVVVQLLGGADKCWTSEFPPTGTKTNDAVSFKAATK